MRTTNLAFLLKKPVTKQAGVSPVLEGHEETVLAAREANDNAKAWKVECELHKTTLREAANELRASIESQGVPCLRVDVPVPDGKKAMITWSKVYSAVNPDHETPLRAILGDAYDDVFVTVTEVTTRKGVTPDQFRSILGDAGYAAIRPLLEEKTYLAPREGYDDVRPQLKLRLGPEQVEVIDAIESECRRSPSVRL